MTYTIGDLVQRDGIEVESATWIDSPGNKWKVRLKRTKSGRESVLEVPEFTMPDTDSTPPTAVQVVRALVRSARILDDTEGVEDWAAHVGLDEDDNVEGLYRAQLDEGFYLTCFLGAEEDDYRQDALLDNLGEGVRFMDADPEEESDAAMAVDGVLIGTCREGNRRVVWIDVGDVSEGSELLDQNGNVNIEVRMDGKPIFTP